MITEKSSTIIIVIIDFNGEDPLDEALDKTQACVKQ